MLLKFYHLLEKLKNCHHWKHRREHYNNKIILNKFNSNTNLEKLSNNLKKWWNHQKLYRRFEEIKSELVNMKLNIKNKTFKLQVIFYLKRRKRAIQRFQNKLSKLLNSKKIVCSLLIFKWIQLSQLQVEGFLLSFKIHQHRLRLSKKKPASKMF